MQLASAANYLFLHICTLVLGIIRYPLHFAGTLSFSQLIVLSTIYAILVRTARIQRRNISRRLQSLARKQDYSLRKTIRTTFIIVCLLYAAFFLYAVYRVVLTAHKSLSNAEKRKIWRWLTAFSFLNSCFYPSMYFFGMKRYWASFRQRISQRGNHITQQCYYNSQGRSQMLNKPS
jgi:hypothetical protein